MPCFRSGFWPALRTIGAIALPGLRRTREHSKSALHFLQFGSIAVPTLFALFFEINALFFLIAAVAIIVHHLVAFTDVRYANSARGIPPIEQMVHSFLEIMPITAFLLLAVTHGTQLLALVGAGQTAPDFAFHAKVNPLPFWYVFSAVGGATLLNFIPYTEEFLRCRRAAAALKRSERH